MKKVLATAAGLMLVGTMVSSAVAAIDVSGSARVRGYVTRNYDAGLDNPRTNEAYDRLHTRFRVKFSGSTESGAYGAAQIKMAEGTMDGAASPSGSVAGDYGYVGVPVGPVTFEGGIKSIDVTPFFFNDERSDYINVSYANDMTTVGGFYIKANEGADMIDDEDTNIYAALLKQKFGGDMALTVFGYYVSDEADSDNSGMAATMQFAAPNAGPVNLVAEFSYVGEELSAGPDAGYGAYVQAGMDFGAASVTFNGGFTADGYIADASFGFTMIGGDSSLTPAVLSQVGAVNGAAQDTFWAGAIVGFKVSDALSLKATGAYADADIATAFEISGGLSYALIDGATVSWDVGYLALDVDGADAENPFGSALTLAVSF